MISAMVSAELFVELSVILGIAVCMALLMRFLRQPLIIGHILSGLLVGPFVLDFVRSTEVLQFLGQIGVAFLLFSVGLGLNPRILKSFGRVALATGLGQVVLTTAAGFMLATSLGIAPEPAFYVALALSFSSTIIILKLISDKGDNEKLYAKIAIGFLLVQDFIAVLLMFSLPLIAAGGDWRDLLLLVLKGAILVTLVLLVAFRILARFDEHLARSQELLFLFANAWGIGIAAIFWKAGFSLEIGALVAGIGLSVLPSRHEVASRLAPLRDFFLVLFFILLGAQMNFAEAGAEIALVAAFSILILIGNPLILMVITGLLGYRKKTSLQAGFTVAQISEFSLILVALGVRLGHVPPQYLSVVTLTGLITIFGSTYLVLYSDHIYRRLAPYLGMFERRRVAERAARHRDHEIFVFGGSRVGFDFIELFRKKKKDFAVVDYDPEVVSALAREKTAVEYGDAEDIDFLDDLRLESALLVVSTVPDLETNLLILRATRRASERAAVLAVAHSIRDALALYEEGVDYVILPHFLGAKYASHLTERYLEDAESFQKLKKEHLAHLKIRAAKGHDHPAFSRLW